MFTAQEIKSAEDVADVFQFLMNAVVYLISDAQT